MNILSLSLAYTTHRPLSTLLNVVLLSTGIATITVLLLFGDQLHNAMTKNADGFDLVIGAKGSPVQLILSTIYQADIPTGNVSKNELDKILEHPAVKSSIPMALGDSYHGFRIVGTTPAYIEHYGAHLRDGRMYSVPLEVVLGADVAHDTKLVIGSSFAGSHGLVEGGEEHEHSPYTVVGILQKSGTVLDRLVITPVESVWVMHSHEEPDSEEEHEEHEEPDAEEEKEEARKVAAGDHSITAALISYSSPMAAATFPRYINTATSMQAASPAVETTRLLQLVGIGFSTLRIFGILLTCCAAFSVFVALYNALLERKPDLAIMRTLGASRFQLCSQIILEGVMVAFISGVVGIFFAHTSLEIISRVFLSANQFQLSGFQVLPEECGIFVVALLVGFVAALLPAYQAYRTDIAHVLARG